MTAAPSHRVTSLVRKFSEDHSMASHVDASGPRPETYSCAHCGRQYSLLCELNKHFKRHSRPFKCVFRTCKYHTLGWPTAKELTRHVNDKHSPAPETYPCLFRHCPYKSKRESNCKQHMEKVHGWKYEKSKSNTVAGSRLVPSRLVAPRTLPQAYSSRSLSPKSNASQPQVQNDFILFPHEPGRASSDTEHGNNGHMALDDPGRQAPDVVIPWASPDTRLRRNKTILHTFTQNFGRAEDDLPVDPQLSSVGGAIPHSKSSMAKISPNSSSGADHTATRLDPATKEEHTMLATTLSLASPPFMLALQDTLAGSLPPSNHGQSSSGKPMQSPAAVSLPHGTYQVLRASKRKGDEDPEDGHPQKRLKTLPKLDFKENRMPDIFLAAYPKVYNRETRSLYHPCETEHTDISTLVRHLSRVPHRLYVSARCIHSFDVQPAELSHAKCGVCRRCWGVFTSREAMDNHLLTECEKVSRSKREKWQVLYDSFTPLAADGPSTTNATQPPSQPNAVVNNRGQYGGSASVAEDDSPVPPPPPTAIDLGLRLPPGQESGGEVEQLHRRVRELEAVVQNQANGIMILSRLAGPDLLEAIDGGSDFASGSGTRSCGWLTSPADGLVEHDTPDAATLVGQMNSQPTDVYRQGMMDDIQQTFSRTSSCISGSDKSTIRHVPISPPRRYEAYHGADANFPHSRPVNPSGGSMPIWHQPTSLPDSGYGSDKKRNGITGPGLAKQPDPAYPQPVRATSPLPKDQAARPGTGSPTCQAEVEGPRSTLGSPSALSLDPLLSSTDIWLDPSATQVEAEACYYLSKDVMEQFDVTGYSQPSSSFSS